MNKGSKILTVLICGVLIGGSVYRLRSVGFLKKPPKPQYLTESEAAVRPAYRQLSEREQAIYEALMRGISEKSENVQFPYEISGDEYTKVYCLFEKQEGEAFYLGSSYFVSDKMRRAHIEYRDDTDTFAEKEAALSNVEKEVIGGLPKSEDDYDKVLYIHDYIVKNCEYVTGEEASYNSTAYGCLVDHKANCEGYSKAFGLLAADAGLESVLVLGRTDKDENHAWNQVKVNGEWYNIDVTWDDTDDDGMDRKLNFLCDDDMFGKNHYPRDNNFEIYECKALAANYYVRNGRWAETEEEAEEILRNALRDGGTGVELVFSNQKAYRKFKEFFIENEYIFRAYIEERNSEAAKISAAYTENEAARYLKIDFSES